MAALDFPNAPTIGQKFEGFTWDGSKWITGGDGAASGSTTISGSNGAITPVLSSIFLELNNTSGVQHAGGEIRFSYAGGDPYATIKGEDVSGPGGHFGDIAFNTRIDETSPLERRLRLTHYGALVSGPPSAEGGGTGNFVAHNDTGYQNFLGYTHNANSADFGVINCSGYFVADNDLPMGTPGPGGWGVYGEGRIWNSGGVIGAELDAQNLSGVNARDINPNDMFGVGAAPWCACIWTQATGSHPGVSYDVSCGLGFVYGGIPGHGDPRLRKGIVFSKDAIRNVNGHMEALVFSEGQEIVWYNAANSNLTTRMLSNGQTVDLYSSSFSLITPNAFASSMSIGVNATGDRSAYLYFGSSTAGGNADALIHRTGGVNGQLQIQNSGTGPVVFIANGTRGYIDGNQGNWTFLSATDANAAGDAAVMLSGGLWAQKGIVTQTYERVGSYLSVGSTAPPANQAPGDLSFVNGFGSGTSFTMSSAGPYTPQIGQTNRANDTSASYWVCIKQRDGGPNNGAVQVGDGLGTFVFAGKDQSGVVRNAAMIASQVESVGASAVASVIQIAPNMGTTAQFSPNYTYISTELRIAGDGGGAAALNTITGVSNLAANSTGVGSIKFKSATSRDSSGFIKIYIGTTAYYVPVFSAIT